MDVSIIIVNYNTLKITKNTIDSVIEKTKDLNYEIILVDNASTDGSVEFFQKEYKDKIIFIKNNENLGFGRANNKGIEIARGKYVFLLNPDTLLINNAVKILFDFMEKNKDCGVCGGNLFDENLQPNYSFDELPTSNLIKEFFKKKRNFNDTEKAEEVGFVLGADMFIKKCILEKIGFFDEDFFMFYEELELTYRIKKNNYKVISVPEAQIIHLEQKSSKSKDLRIKQLFNGKYKYFYKTENLKTCKKIYYSSQIFSFIKYFLTFKKEYLKKIKMNKEEYNKFLLNYKNLRRNNL